MPRAPKVAVKTTVAWDRRAQGYFKIGRSKIGSPDGLAPVAFADVFGGVFDDISGDVDSLTIDNRGRASLLEPVGSTSITVNLNDPGRVYDVKNPASPLAGKLQPLRPIRVSAVGPAFRDDLILSGNEITDATRALGIQGDGRLDDSSFGIWPARTNLVTNGGFETDLTGWTSPGPNFSLARSTEQAKFGSASLKGVRTAVGADTKITNYVSMTLAATPYTASVWVYIPSGWDGTQLELSNDASFTGDSGVNTVLADLTKRDQWQRLSITFTPVSGDLSGFPIIIRDWGSSVGKFIYIDGAQIETGAVATPYIHTDGATATRPAARVQAPATLVNSTQSWVAARVRLDFDSTVATSTHRIATYRDDGNNRAFDVYWDGGGHFIIARYAGGASTAALAASGGFSAGTEFTIVATVTETTIAISVNGAPFVSVGNTYIPTIAAATFDIGGYDGTQAYLDGDVLSLVCGTGTLTDQDAAAVYAAGPDKGPSDYQDVLSSATVTAVFSFSTSRYLVPDVEQPRGFAFLRTGGTTRRARGSSSQLECVDLFVWLNRKTVDDEIAADTTVGAQIGAWLDAVGWTDPAMRSLDVGSEIPARPSTGSRPVLTLIAELLAVDLGSFFQTVAGAAAYRARNWWVTQPVKATVTAGLVPVSGFSLDTIENRKTATMTGGVAQSYQDDASVDEFGEAGDGGFESGLFLSDEQALSWAHYEVGRKKDPTDPLWSLTLRGVTDEAVATILALDYGDRVQVIDPEDGSVGDYHVEKIGPETYDRGGNVTCTYLLSERPTAIPLKIGSGKIGQKLTY